MTQIRRILFAIRDPSVMPAGALRKVAVLSRASGASIELFHAAGEALTLSRRRRGVAALSMQLTPAATLAHSQQRLERLARSKWLKGCRLRSTVVWEVAPPHEAIVRRALAAGSDLVIARTESHGFGGRLLLRNTDWELIRHCPCPLLLIKSSRGYEKRAVLVAVDPFHKHAKPANLDSRLLAAGRVLSTLGAGPVHAFHAYMPLLAGVPDPFGAPLVWESPEVEAVHGAQVRGEFDRLAQRAGIPSKYRHLLMGDVTSQLCATVKRIKAGVVVMGAVSRSGLQRLVIGNTAERTLDRLACDVLIVRPQGAPLAQRRGAIRAKRHPRRY